MSSVRVERLLAEPVFRAQRPGVRGARFGRPQHGDRRVAAAGGDLNPAEGRGVLPD